MTFSMNDVADQEGRVVIVTGANSGLGYASSLALAAKRLKVVMACRSVEKAEEAKQRILSDIPYGDLEILPMDLSKLASVRDAAERFCSNHDKLDILINNAGIMYPPYIKTEDGFESQMAVNCFGHFLFTSLLIDWMPDSPNSRITWLSSSAHKTGKIDFNDINFEKKYSRIASYGQSKLVCLMYSLELARKLKAGGKEIKSTCAHPGGAITSLSRYMPLWTNRLMKYTILPFITHSTADAVLPILEGALASTAESGQYYGPQGFMEMRGPSGIATKAKQSQDMDAAKRLWALSEQYTGATYKL